MRRWAGGAFWVLVAGAFAVASAAAADDAPPTATAATSPSTPSSTSSATDGIAPVEPVRPPELLTSPRFTHATLGTAYAFASDLEKHRGTLSLLRTTLYLEGGVPVNSRVSLRWAIDLEEDNYDLSKPDAIVAGNGRLLEEGRYGRIAPGLDVRLSDDWAVSTYVEGMFSGAPQADFADSLTWGVYGAVRHRVSPKLAIKVGAHFTTTLEDTPTVVPDFGIEGGPSGAIAVEARANGVRVGYGFSPRFSVGLLAAYYRRDWRLASSDRVPDGVFRDLRIPVGLDVDWAPSTHVHVSVTGGITVYHEIRVDDHHGDTLTNFEGSRAPWISLFVTVKV